MSLLHQKPLKINEDKCNFRATEVQFLGSMISKSGVKPIQKRIDDIVSLKEPSDTKALPRFLGAAVFYLWMIPKLSKTKAPLHDLLSKSDINKKITLNASQKQAFYSIKQKLNEIINMEPIDHKKDLILCTDASKTAVGTSLNHEINGRLAPIAFFSRKLTVAEQKYSTFDRELLAIYIVADFLSRTSENKEDLTEITMISKSDLINLENFHTEAYSKYYTCTLSAHCRWQKINAIY
jgi:RNase H-like domain found in reverse transcriptase